MSDNVFETLDVDKARRELAELYQRVASQKGRIEVTQAGSAESCVLISKTELDSLEKALQILADGEGVKEMCQALSRLATTSQQQFAHA